MPSDGPAAIARVGFWSVWILLAFAAAGSFLAGRIYLIARGTRSSGVGVHRSAPVLGLALAALLVTVQFSLPLSLGLLAALTLVRVRTPIKEPEEVGLLMLVMAVAVSAAALKLELLGGALLAGLVGSWVTRRAWPVGQARGHTRVSIAWSRPGGASDDEIRTIDARLGARSASLQRLGGGPGGVRLEYHLASMSSDARAALVASITAEAANAQVEVAEVPPAPDLAD